MANQTSGVEAARLFARLTSIGLTLWAATFLVALGVGIIALGHVPEYGIDPDPYALNPALLNGLFWLNLVSFFAFFIALTAWPLLVLHLLINRVSFTFLEKRWLVAACLAILLFLLFHTI